MEKNSFLIYNDIICSLYTCQKKEDLKIRFLVPLGMLIPYSYSSLLFSASSHEKKRNPQNPSELYESPPLCVPEDFTEAEETYIRNCREDPMLWMIHGRESILVREGDLLPEEHRLHSPLYLRCYEKYNIFDTLQYSIVKDQQFLGILTLFRTKDDKPFTDNEMFFLRSLGIHLNAVLEHLQKPAGEPDGAGKLSPASAASRFRLTPREEEILSLLLQYKNNDEIARSLTIKETTLQKHIQNIFRKCQVSSKWELLRLLS